MAKKYSVTVDRNRCVSSGNCADLVGTVFTQDDDTGVVELLQAEPDSSVYEAVKKAVQCCPAQAISIVEHDD